MINREPEIMNYKTKTKDMAYNTRKNTKKQNKNKRHVLPMLIHMTNELMQLFSSSRPNAST